MSDGTFQLKVFSGRGLEVEATVRSANVPSEGGELGFLPNHCEYVGLLSTGIGEYIAASGGSTAQKFIASGGIVTFSNNVLTLLADTVDLPEQAFYMVGTLDSVRAKAEKLAAEFAKAA